MPDRDLSYPPEARGQWSSGLMFTLAAAGSAIGLGNIWKFPYLAGKYGGGAFVLLYLFFILLVGIPILAAEIAIGRQARRNPVGAFKVLGGGNPLWTSVGVLGVLSGFVILSYYSVVAGWTLDYFSKSAWGVYMGADAARIQALFSEMMANPWDQVVWHTVFMAATIAIVLSGVKEGLERWIAVLMPLLVLILLLLVAYSLLAGDARKGLSYLFVPHWSRLVLDANGNYTARPMLEALGQAFFSLSLGMGAVLTYGSYLRTQESIPKSAIQVAFFDTAIALLAAVAIFPILFRYDLDPTVAGPGLAFKVLPMAFSKLPAGRFIGTAFFALLFFAALTSSISLLEVVVAYFIDDRRWARKTAALIMGFVIWALGIPSALSYNLLGGFTLFRDRQGQGLPFLDSVDLLATNYMLPIGGFFIALFAGWRHRAVARRQLVDVSGSSRFHGLWSFVVRFVTPLAVGLLILSMLDRQFGLMERIFRPGVR